MDNPDYVTVIRNPIARAHQACVMRWDARADSYQVFELGRPDTESGADRKAQFWAETRRIEYRK